MARTAGQIAAYFAKGMQHGESKWLSNRSCERLNRQAVAEEDADMKHSPCRCRGRDCTGVLIDADGNRYGTWSLHRMNRINGAGTFMVSYDANVAANHRTVRAAEAVERAARIVELKQWAADYDEFVIGLGPDALSDSIRKLLAKSRASWRTELVELEVLNAEEEDIRATAADAAKDAAC